MFDSDNPLFLAVIAVFIGVAVSAVVGLGGFLYKLILRVIKK